MHFTRISCDGKREHIIVRGKGNGIQLSKILQNVLLGGKKLPGHG